MQLPTHNLHHVAAAPETSPLGPLPHPQELIRSQGGRGPERDKSDHWAGQGRAVGKGHCTQASPQCGGHGRRTERWSILPLTPHRPGLGTGGWTGD